ncbi:MAG: PQQ-binding-like beta-propeller repeat protein [Acidobacteria bacterium]|nr:PQQ-binding-like beta-propeller repeat protein [Acidobacteriota bacterium]
MIITLILLALLANDWPRFRGPNGSGVAEGTEVPIEFGPAKNLIWKTTVPFSRSSPVIAGDNIFLTATENDKLIVMSLDRSTGRIRWRRDLERSQRTPHYKYNDAASISPTADQDSVYAFFPDLGLIAFTHAGDERWRLPLGPFDTFYGLGASPILHEDTVLLLCDTRRNAFLLAIDKKTGRVRWRVDRKDTRLEAYASPVLWQPAGEPAQVIVLGSNRIDAYSVANGERVWWFRGLASLPIGSPIVGDGMVVVSTYGADSPPGPTFDEWLKSDENSDGRMSENEVRKAFKDFDEFGAIDTNSDGFIDRAEWEMLQRAAIGNYGLVAVELGGRGDLSATSLAWNNRKASSFIPSPLLYQGIVYAVESGGIVNAIDVQNGNLIKVDRSRNALGEYWASPVAAGGKIFLASQEGKITVLKAGRDWEILAVNELGEECYATPAISNGRIFIRTQNALYAFGEL